MPGLLVGVGEWAIVGVSALVGTGVAVGCGPSSHADSREVAIKHRAIMEKVDDAHRLRLFRPAIFSYIRISIRPHALRLVQCEWIYTSV